MAIHRIGGSHLKSLLPQRHEIGKDMDMHKAMQKTGRSGNPANKDQHRSSTYLGKNRVPVPQEMASKVKNKFKLGK